MVSGIFLSILFLSLILPSLNAVTSRKDALISFIYDCKAELGFKNTPTTSESTLEATFQALYILKAYNRLGEIDSAPIIEFVNNCRNEDHGYGNTIGSNSTIFATYYALWITNLFDVVLDNDTDDWIAMLYNETSGFSAQINASGSLYATYFGLEALYINSTNLSQFNLSTWLLGRQNTDSSSDNYGGFATDGNNSNLWATWAAMGSIDRLNISGGFLIEPLVSWINQSQNLNIYEDSYGAFGSKPSENDYSLLHTYAAIYSLQKLGETYLSRINLDAALNWILDLQNKDGGFRVSSPDADSTLSAIYYAFCALDLAGERGRLLNDVPWEYKFQMPLWLWILIGVAIAITAIILIKKYYMY